MHFRDKVVLVLAPHTDDGELGAGGTISRCISEGAEVWYAAFSTADDSLLPGFEEGTLKGEVKAATSRLGIPENRLVIFNIGSSL